MKKNTQKKKTRWKEYLCSYWALCFPCIKCTVYALLKKTKRVSILNEAYYFKLCLGFEFIRYLRTKEVQLNTLYNTILRIARNFLETRENIKILTHPFYHINLVWFSWEWSKKKNSKSPTQKKWVFQNRQFSNFFIKNSQIGP